jgi:hypothetical protein
VACGGCFRNSVTTYCVLVSTSVSVLNISSEVSANTFTFSSFVIAISPLCFRGGILRLVFVELLVILQVSFVLVQSRLCRVHCQVFDTSSLIAESISFLKSLMRGRRGVRGIVGSLPQCSKIASFLNEKPNRCCNLH